MSANIVSGVTLNVEKDYVYNKAKVNANGRKNIGILNSSNMKSLYMSTPLMLTWGVNEYTDEKTGVTNSYDLALQFPKDEYGNPDCTEFLKNMQALETKLKADAIVNSKDWLNKNKLVPEAVDALWSPMLKYPKDKETGEPDYSRAPTLKVKLPFWEGAFKNMELYNEKQELMFPTDEDHKVSDFIIKGTNIATIIQCGGIWVANGKFGVTWKLFQAVVKPRATLSGKCHIMLSKSDQEKLETSVADDDDEVDEIVEHTARTHVSQGVTVEDSDEEEPEPEPEPVVKEEVKAAIAQKKVVATEDVPKVKKVVKKKKVVAAATTDE